MMKKPAVELISSCIDYRNILKEACSTPYGSKDMTMKKVAAIVDSGHLSVLEHCTATFRIKCSVRVLGQMTRHRHLSFTCKSARGSEFDTLVIPSDKTDEVYHDAVCSSLNYNGAFDLYNFGLEQGLSNEEAAYFLPQGAQTEFVVTGNFRAWYEYLPKRLCKRAMPEHRQVCELIHNALAMAVPEIFDKDFMNCKNCKERSCSFK